MFYEILIFHYGNVVDLTDFSIFFLCFILSIFCFICFLINFTYYCPMPILTLLQLLAKFKQNYYLWTVSFYMLVLILNKFLYLFSSLINCMPTDFKELCPLPIFKVCFYQIANSISQVHEKCSSAK